MMDMFRGTGTPLTVGGFDAAADALGVTGDQASLWSILSVETRGFGYLPDKRPKILFERHVFSRRTLGRFDASDPDISNPNAGGYIGGTAEYGRLLRALALDRKAAVESASWGLGQVMGFNATSLAYDGAEDMVAKFMAGEDAQLDGCVRYVRANKALANAFRSHDWPRVAFFYNGADYQKNGYDAKLGDAYSTSLSDAPQIDVRLGQVRLTYAGFDTRGIDGRAGPATRAALAAFQRSKNLPVTDAFDEKTDSALAAAAGV